MKFNCPECKSKDFWLVCQSRKRFSGELELSKLSTDSGITTWEVCCDRCGWTWEFPSIDEVKKDKDSPRKMIWVGNNG